MQNLLIVAAAAAVVFQTHSPHGRVTRPESVLVRYVIDGDTIEVATVGRVRLLGIDAPEIGRGFDTPAPYGREARARLDKLKGDGMYASPRIRRSYSMRSSRNGFA